MNFDVFRLHRQHAGFRRQDQQAVVGDQVARRAQAVAIERGADHVAIGEGDRGGTVPRLHQRRVIFVERLLLRTHGGVGIPRFGNQHGHDVRQRAAGQRQQLDRVVERGRIAAAGRDDREELLDIVAEQRRSEHGLRARASS